MADAGVGVYDFKLLMVLSGFEEGVHVNDCVGLESVGEVVECMERGAWSNVGDDDDEDLGIESCGGCA